MNISSIAGNTFGQAGISKLVAQYAEGLNEKHRKINIQYGNYLSKNTFKSTARANVLISPEYTEKAAVDEKLSALLDNHLDEVKNAYANINKILKKTGTDAEISSIVVNKLGKIVANVKTKGENGEDAVGKIQLGNVRDKKLNMQDKLLEHFGVTGSVFMFATLTEYD